MTVSHPPHKRDLKWNDIANIVSVLDRPCTFFVTGRDARRMSKTECVAVVRVRMTVGFHAAVAINRIGHEPQAVTA